jgi:tRNA(fMet)-specific endonuclease VapC
VVRVSYLLDTNIISEPLAKRPNAGVMSKIEANRDRLNIAVVTWEEVRFGMHLLPPGRRREQIRDYLDNRIRPSLPILSFDARAAEWQAEHRARLRRTGRTPAYADAQIAAVAAVNGLVLVTRNTGDFADFEGLRIECWFS